MSFTCPICVNGFLPSSDSRITKCGHLFHYICLLQWIEHNPTCPQCRQKTQENDLIRVFPNFDEVDNVTKLVEENDNLQKKLEMQYTFKAEYEKNLIEYKNQIKYLINCRTMQELDLQYSNDERDYYRNLSKERALIIAKLETKLDEVETALKADVSLNNGDGLIQEVKKGDSFGERVLNLKRKLHDCETENKNLLVKYKSMKNKYFNYRSITRTKHSKDSEENPNRIQSNSRQINESCVNWNRIVSTCTTSAPTVEPVTCIILDE